ncbi:MAG: nitronate monooxygenase, partial [Dehalococcoidia bacterium]
MSSRKLHTRLCDVLEIEYPIIQAGMGGFSDPPLVIAVSEAGGLGTLGGAPYEPDSLDTAIKEIKKGTSKPFAVDLLLPDSLKDMEGISKEGLMKYIPDDYLEYIKELKKKFGIPEDYRSQRAGSVWTMEGTKGLIEACLDNKIPVLAAGLGRLGWVMPECKKFGIKTIGIGANVIMALKHVEDQVDVIVAQGYDAGGHTGNIGTMALVPQIVDAVKPIPIAAAGGIADGRGLVAALTLGADGVWCGSMFLLAPEATFTEGQKDRVIAATERDAVITKAITGKTLRQLRTPFTEIWDKGPKPPLGWPFHNLLTLD